ncbi:MAG: ATP-binding protein [Saccharothrix sp.]|nr:ATP-binding protein [Saccharothrix sp.]
MNGHLSTENHATGHVVVQAGVINGNVVTGGDPTPVPHELPAIPAQFVERDLELGRLDSALRSDDPGRPAIAVVVGTAGVGKTALAVSWAHHAAQAFPDGQLFIDLHGFDDEPPVNAREATSRLLRSVGVARPEEIPTEAERSARLRTALAGRRMILVLDNARSAHQVLPLLPGAGPAVVIVTSRRVLSGLHLRHGAHHVRVEPLDVSAGARLLVASSGRRVPPDDASTRSLAHLCAGLPLALRIVAERLAARPALTAAALADQLTGEGTRLTALSREVDVSAVFECSYRELDAVTAAVFRAFGVGPRHSLGIDAVTAASGRGREEVEGSLDQLCRAHLITEQPGNLYGLHDLLRAYAGQLSRAQREAHTDAQRRLFEHYLHTAARADLILTPHRTRIPLVGEPTVVSDLPDARAAREWLRREEPNMIELFRVDDPAFDVHRWQLAYVLRTYFYLTKQLDGWLETHSHALRAAVRRGDRWAEAMTCNNLGMAMTAAGRPAEAAELYRRARELFDDLGDGHGRSNAVNNMASVLRRQGEPAAALVLHQEALAYYRRTDATGNVGITLRGMADAHLRSGQPREAAECAREALEIATRFAYDLDIAQAATTLAAAYRAGNEPARAESALRHAIEAAERCGSRHEQARAWHDLGTLAAAAGRGSDAAGHWQRALTLYRAMGSPREAAVAADLRRLAEVRGEPGVSG